MHRRTASYFLAAAALVAGGCAADAPTGTTAPTAAPHYATASAELNQHLSALRRVTAPFHHMRNAEEAGYTVALGCVSDDALGGMGYHFAHQDLSRLGDDRVSLLEPEFLVYAPDKHGKLKLAAFDYFIPYSATWPGPRAGGAPPTLLGMEMHPSERFNAWIFHIWLWRHNPAGMFADFNPDVPLCE
jgi:hypothetical protein